MLSALRTPGVRWVAALYAFDYLVELAAAIALMVLVYDATDSPLAASLMLVCKQVVPGTTMTLLAPLLERVRPRTGLTATYLIATLALAALAAAGYGVALYVVAFVAGLTGSVARALLRVVVARALDGAARRATNGLLNVLMGAIALAGPALGGLIVAASSPRAALWAMAAASLALAALSAGMPGMLVRASAPGIEEADDADEAAEDEAPTAGASRVPAWSLLVVGGLVMGLFAMDEPALLAYARDSLGSDVNGYALILVAWGVGMLLGGLAYARLLARDMSAVFGWGAALAAACYVGLGVAPGLAVALAVAVLGGAGNGVYWVALVTAVQESAADAEQGRYAARLEGIATAAPALGVVVGGLVAEYVSPRASLWLPGALALLALAVWALAVRVLSAATQSAAPLPAVATGEARA